MRLPILLFASAVLVLWGVSRLAERGVRTARELAPSALPATAVEDGASADELAALQDALRSGAPAFAEALDAEPEPEEASPVREPRPHAPFEDAPVRPLPRNVFVSLIAPLTHRTWFEDVTAIQTTRRGEVVVEAWPVDEERRVWALGSPELLAGEHARFDLRATALGRSFRGEFTVSRVPAMGDVRLDEPIALEPQPRD